MKPAIKQSLLGGTMLLAVWLAGLCERQMVNTQFMLRLSKISGGELLLPVFLSLVSGTTVGLLAWLGREKKLPQLGGLPLLGALRPLLLPWPSRWRPWGSS